MEKTALIIGGSRFFGRHLAKELTRRGLSVTLLNRGRADDGLGSKVRRMVADRSNPAALEAALAGSRWDYVFDQVCFNGPDAEAAGRLLRGKTDRLIFTSTQSVYGMGRALKEEDFDPVRYLPPSPRAEDYASLKREAEAAYVKFPELRIAMVRIPIVLGLDDYTGRLKWHVDRIARELPIHVPNPSARLGFVKSDVAGRMIADLATTDFSGPINIACPGEISVGEIVSTIERATSKKASFSTAENDENGQSISSPFGIEEDWTMDLSRMKKLGLEAPALGTWFPDLVRELTEVSRTS